MPESTAIGDLRDRVSLYAPVRSAGPTGQPQVSYPTLAGIVWAKVRPIGSVERTAIGQQLPECEWVVTIRPTPFEIRSDWRLRWGQRTANVVGIVHAVPPMDWTELYCKETPPRSGQ